MRETIKHYYEFGQFCLDVTERLLFRNNEHIPLPPKTVDTLLVLVENRGHVIEKQELLRLVWPDTFVEEVNLAKNISALRKILGGDFPDQFIETIPKRGYRFTAPVKEVKGEDRKEYSTETVSSSGISESFIPAGEVAGSASGMNQSGGGSYSAGTGVATSRSVLSDPINNLHLTGNSDVPLGDNLGLYKGLFIFLTISIGVMSLIILLYLNRSRDNSDNEVKRGVVPVTALPGSEDHPSFSPDGNQVVFSWNGEKEDNTDIYIKVIGSEYPLRLTSDPNPDTDPVIMPDGRFVAFLRRAGSSASIYLIPTLGGAERKLSDIFPYQPIPIGSNLAISPDGKYLAVPHKESDSNPFSIYLVSTESGQKARLTTPKDGIVGDLYPSFSRDGRYLAFSRLISIASSDIYTVSLNESMNENIESRITSDNMMIRGLCFTVNSREIVYASRRKGSIYNLWKVSLSGGVPEPVTNNERDTISPALSPLGDRLIYVQSLIDPNIWRIFINESGTPSAPPQRLIASTFDEDSPSFSPDGKKIVFVSRRTGNFELWICTLDGSKPRQLTNIGGALTGTPRWSPDGRLIVFDCWVGANADIYVINAEGGQPRRITQDPSEDITPSWSGDSTHIYFASLRSGKMQLWRIQLEGGNPVQVTKDGGFEGFESPDGKSIYYSKGRGVPGIWSIPLPPPVGKFSKKIVVDNRKETPVLDQNYVGLYRYWGVTKKGIYFASAQIPSQPKLEFYDFNSKRIQLITELNKPLLRGLPGLAVSYDEGSILVTQVDQGGYDLMLMEGFK